MERTSCAVAIFCDDSTGHLNPMLGMTEALTKHGWEAHFFAPAGVKDLVEGAGAHWRPMGHEDYETRSAAMEVIQKKLGMEVPEEEINVMPFRVVPATVAVLPHLLDSVAKLAPRFIVFDACAPWGSLVAELLGLPAVSLMTAVPEPMASRDEASKRWSPYAQRILDATTAVIKSNFGIDFNHNHSYSIYSPYTVICSSRSWHKGHEEFPESQFHYWGTLVSERKGAPVAQGGDAVQGLLADESFGRTGHPLFFCSLGTVTTGAGFAKFGSAVQEYYRKLCKAAALLPHVTFIFAVGNVADIKEEAGEGGAKRVSELFGEPVPANVVVARSVDQPRLLMRASGFLTHCGQNSAMEAVLAGVPVVMAPFFGDQIMNALRFAELGCGLVQSCYADLKYVMMGGWSPDPSVVTPEALAEAMRRVLEEPGFAEAMAQLRDRQEAEVNQRTMAEKLESLAEYADRQAEETQPRCLAWAQGSKPSFAGA